MAFFEANPKVRFEDQLALDVVIGHGVRLGWLDENQQLPAAAYGSHKAAAWQSFYRYSPTRCRELVVAALRQLTGV